MDQLIWTCPVVKDGEDRLKNIVPSYDFFEKRDLPVTTICAKIYNHETRKLLLCTFLRKPPYKPWKLENSNMAAIFGLINPKKIKSPHQICRYSSKEGTNQVP